MAAPHAQQQPGAAGATASAPMGGGIISIGAAEPCSAMARGEACGCPPSTCDCRGCELHAAFQRERRREAAGMGGGGGGSGGGGSPDEVGGVFVRNACGGCELFVYSSPFFLPPVSLSRRALQDVPWASIPPRDQGTNQTPGPLRK